MYFQRKHSDRAAQRTYTAPRSRLVKDIPDSFKPVKIGGFWVKPSWNDDPIPHNLTLLNLDQGSHLEQVCIQRPSYVLNG